MGVTSILINGSPYGNFSPSRGLRQGDPLSPALFILVSELLSRILLKEEANGALKGIKICRKAPSVSHLFFADDLIIFAKASIRDAGTIEKVLAKYSAWSGQKINKNKLLIHFSKNFVG